MAHRDFLRLKNTLTHSLTHSLLTDHFLADNYLRQFYETTCFVFNQLTSEPAALAYELKRLQVTQVRSRLFEITHMSSACVSYLLVTIVRLHVCPVPLMTQAQSASNTGVTLNSGLGGRLRSLKMTPIERWII